MTTNILEIDWTRTVLLIHLIIFILNICLTLLLMKFKDARVTMWCLIIVAATPLFNIWLLCVLIYELLLTFLDWRRR